ncbi:MAG: MOSC domain-containing protein [Zoogloeaceae bacterium]|nr:MOSC domain-containing protein [Zoogloeaceae bacterium]
MTIVLSALFRYPVKSMAGESLAQSPVGPLGLPHDREWMVADRAGRLVTGRDFPELVLVRATPGEAGVALAAPGRPNLFVPNVAFSAAHEATVWSDRFPAWHGAQEADDWLSSYLGARVKLLWTGPATARRVKGHPDVPLSFADGFPLLLIGEASRENLSQRVGRSLAMARFRPNLVISGAAPYAEDDWQTLRIGLVTFRLEKPCERCVFTTVDPDTGEKGGDQEPLRTLAKYRKTPDGVIFGRNVVAEGEGMLEVGMPVTVLAGA